MFTRGYSSGKLVTGVHQICRSNLCGEMWITSVGTKKSVYFLLKILLCRVSSVFLWTAWPLHWLAVSVSSLTHGESPNTRLSRRSPCHWRGLSVAAYWHWYAQRGEGLIRLCNHCPGTRRGDKFYFCSSRLLTHFNQQILSSMTEATSPQQHLSRAHWAWMSCATALTPVTQSLLGISCFARLGWTGHNCYKSRDIVFSFPPSW